MAYNALYYFLDISNHARFNYCCNWHNQKPGGLAPLSPYENLIISILLIAWNS